ncbi:MAG TPA: hypothetical protein VE709_08005 [Pseudonocardiaceae bacterium]|nr:hypothetical protein [Pseudonocardiaceae bacterium]
MATFNVVSAVVGTKSAGAALCGGGAAAAADRFLAGARADEGQISPQVTSVADNIDGARMQGYPDFVLKGEDSFKRKLVTEPAVSPARPAAARRPHLPPSPAPRAYAWEP